MSTIAFVTHLQITIDMVKVHSNVFGFGIYFIFLQLFVVTSYGAYFKLTNMECRDINKNIIRLNACRLKPVKRDITEATVRFQILKPVENCILHVELLRRYNNYQPFFINHTYDACAYLKDRKNHVYFDILYKLVERYTNANHTCPYEGEFVVERFRPLHSNLILPLPTGDYLIKFIFYTSGTLFFNLQVWFGFKELEKRRLSSKKLGTVNKFLDDRRVIDLLIP